jgi:exonuclease SbcD
VDAIREIADLAPVAMIYGTPSHDTDGSLEVFRKIETKHSITILEPGQAYFLDGGMISYEEEWDGYPKLEGTLLFGIPEPRKKYLLAGDAAGKDETEEAVRDAMHRLCFTLAAKRREYPDIPCVVLYHGDVAGSSLQNDQTVERGTGIAVTVDDLGDIDADYYALGHIHKPQQVGSLPAYYAGSIYPKNFGETHQAGFNVYEIRPGEHFNRYQRIDFPHPQNLKIEYTWLEGWPFTENEVKGRRVWLEVTCTREQRAHVGIEDGLEGLMESGAAPGSRVTVNELPVETVRAGEITEAATPERKFEIWAENAGQNIHRSRDRIFAKIGQIQESLTASGGNISGEWSLVSVRLRGAVGIRNGIGKE